MSLTLGVRRWHGGGHRGEFWVRPRWRALWFTSPRAQAIHFADTGVRTGKQGIEPSQLYIELGLHGDDCADQVRAAGIRQGCVALLDRPIRRGFAPDTFHGAYLDNGLGCFATLETARLVAAAPMQKIRVLFAFASWEEIGRFGSRVMAAELRPDALVGGCENGPGAPASHAAGPQIAFDVNHDYNAAPDAGSKKYQDLAMGKGFTVSHGAITSACAVAQTSRPCDLHTQHPAQI